MADWTKVTIDIDGNPQSVELPAYAKQSTQEEMLKALEKLDGSFNTKTLEKSINNLSNETSNNSQTLKQSMDDFTKELDRSNEKIRKSYEVAIGEFTGSMFDIIGKVGLTLGGIFLTGLTVTAGRAINLGNVFNDLTKSGIAFNESQGRAVMQSLINFNNLGISTEDATDIMMDNSQVTRLLTGGIANATAEFLKLTSYGVNLGLTLDDSVNMYTKELSARTEYLNLGTVDAKQRSLLTANIVDTTRKQVIYAQALGTSVEAIQSFVRNVLDDNGAFSSALLRVPTMARENLLKGATDFLGTMRALGGEVGGELGAATLEAATFGALGFSDAAMNFVTVLPSLASTMNGAIRDFESGVLDGADVSEQFAEQLGNLSNVERDRIFAFARAGDETAKELAKAVVQFEQSAKRLEKMGLDPIPVQKGFNAFNVIVKRFSTIIDQVLNTFMSGFGDGLLDVTTSMENLTHSFFRFVNTALGDAETGLMDFGRRVGQKTAEFIDYLDGFMTALTESGMTFKELGEMIKVGISNLLQESMEALVDGLVYAMELLFTHPKVIGAMVALITALALTRGIPLVPKGPGGKLKTSTVVSSTVATTATTGAILDANGNPMKTDGPDKPKSPKKPGLGKVVGKGLFTKILAPLGAYLAVSEGVAGAQTGEGGMQKTGRGISSALNNLTFGILGKSSDEYRYQNEAFDFGNKTLAMANQSGATVDFTEETMMSAVMTAFTKDKETQEKYRQALIKFLESQDTIKSKHVALDNRNPNREGYIEPDATFSDDSMMSLLQSLNRLIKINEQTKKSTKAIEQNS
jgi:hypothetical protein